MLYPDECCWPVRMLTLYPKNVADNIPAHVQPVLNLRRIRPQQVRRIVDRWCRLLPPLTCLMLADRAVTAVILLFVTSIAASVATRQQAPSTEAVAESDIELRTPTGVLRGTLCQPDPIQNRRIVALLIAGSGPTDRNGNQASRRNDSLKQLARGLAANGAASVRYDRRGVGESVTAPNEADIRIETFVSDAAAWLSQLKSDRRFSRVGVVGHSEGALVGMLAAAQGSADAFVSLAGIGRGLAVVLREQIGRSALSAELKATAGTILEELAAGRRVIETPTELAAVFRPSVQPFLISEMKYDPARELAKLSVPVLVVEGTTDLQVSQEDARVLAAASPRAKLMMVDGMNHVLKLAQTQAEQQAAYLDPTTPIAPKLASAISVFLQEAMAKR